MEGPSILYELACASTAPGRRDPPAWSRRFREAAIVAAGDDDGVRDAGHLGRRRRVPFPSPVRVLRIETDAVLQLPASTLARLHYGTLRPTTMLPPDVPPP